MASGKVKVQVDVLVIAAADGEDDALREVESQIRGAGEAGEWKNIQPEGYPLEVWFREIQRGDKRLRVALSRPSKQGGEASAAAAARLVAEFGPRCLAMCGVCAGRPDWRLSNDGDSVPSAACTNLGDVIIADRLWRYDTGEIVFQSGTAAEFRPDIEQYRLSTQWKRAAETLASKGLGDAPWISSRPKSTQWQELWVLRALNAGIPILDPSKRVELDSNCPDWKTVYDGLSRRGLVEIAGGVLAITAKGRDYLVATLMPHKGDLPPQPGWRVHVGPLATGAALQRRDGIWDTLASTQQRLVRGLDMEGSAIGMVGFDHKIDTIVVKGVMDHGESQRHHGFRRFAAKAAAEVLIAFLMENLEPRKRREILSKEIDALPANPQPSQLLTARFGVVPFMREATGGVWEELEAWCLQGQGPTVRLFTGPGGAGKTRLLTEFARVLRDEHGWTAGFFSSRGITKEEALANIDAVLAETGQVLLVLDYAETRQELVAMLARIQDRARSREGAVRVALLARGVGDWWVLVKERADGEKLDIDSTPHRLPELELKGGLRAKMFDAAFARFADGTVKAARTGPPKLDDKVFARALYVHMAALAAANGLPMDAASLLEGVLKHEKSFLLKRWLDATRTDEAQNPGYVAATSRFMGAVTLWGGVGKTDSLSGLERAQALNTVAKGPDEPSFVEFIGGVYSGRTDKEFIAPVEPDILGEALVSSVMEDKKRTSGTYLPTVMEGADNEERKNAFTVLARLELAGKTDAGGWIDQLLEADFAGHAVPALFAAISLGEQSAHATVARRLSGHAQRQGSPGFARLCHSVMPVDTVSMRELAAWAAGVLVEQNQDAEGKEEKLAERAGALNDLGNRLSELGHREAALETTREAVKAYRALSKARPDAFLPDLAMSLNNLRNRLSELGHREAALEATREAVEIRRALSKASGCVPAGPGGEP